MPSEKTPISRRDLVGSLVNLYVVWRIRSLRNRPAAQWRAQPVSTRQRRAEAFQIGLALLSLVLVAIELWTHRIVHNA